jgi:hypothetical protein
MTYEEAMEVQDRGDAAGVSVDIYPGYFAVFSFGSTSDYNIACNEIRARTSEKDKS